METWEWGWGVEPGNEAGEWSLGMRLGSGAWEWGWGVEPGNGAGDVWTQQRTSQMA